MMATLPPGWVSDYDGKRWFWIYEATNHTQYTFPKEGDEWPDFAGFSGTALDHVVIPTAELLPEERLESERQVKRSGTRDTTAVGGGAAAVGEKSTGEKSEERDDDCGGTIDFENFGYFGPGAWEEVASPAREEERGTTGAASGVRAPSTVTSPPASVSELSAGATAFNKSDVSVTDGGNPQAARARRPRHPTETEPTRPFDQTADSSQAHTAPPPQATPEIPMLDGREVAPSPLGQVPELASESTALCADETNPPPVELPDTAATWLEPVPVPNLVNQYPVELSAAGRSLDDERDPPAEGRPWRGSEGHRAVTVQAELEGRPLDAHQQELYTPSAQGVPQGMPEQPSRVSARSGLPSRQGQVPAVPPKLPLEQPPPQTKQVLSSYTRQHCAMDTPSIRANSFPAPLIPGSESRQSAFASAAQISHVPSVLRPGPRRSSQPPLPSRRSMSLAAGPGPTPVPAPAGTGGDEKYRAFQLSSPLRTPAERRGHAQSLIVRTSEEEGFVMPNPDDHVQPLRLPQRSHVPLASPPVSPPAGIPQRPSGFLKMPSEPSRSAVRVPPELSPPSHAPGPGSPSAFNSPHQADQTPAARTPEGPRQSPMPASSPSPPPPPPSLMKQPAMIEPDADERPPQPSPKTFTSFADLDLPSSRTKKLKDVFSRQALKRIVGKEKDPREAEAAGPLRVLGEAESNMSAHAYIPPKGPREVAPEWSWGHAE